MARASMDPAVQPFAHLARVAQETPDRLFFHALAQRMTYGEAADAARRIAGELREIGVRPGDTVALDLPGGLHLVVLEALFHEAAIGWQQAPGASGADRLVPDWLITTTVRPATGARRTIVVDAPFLRRVGARSTAIEPQAYPSPQAICRIVFSSGTTGYPKPVAFSIEMIEYRAVCAAGFWMRTPPFLSLLDVGTVSGFQAFYAAVMRGETYLVPGDPNHNVALIDLHEVASIKASPAQVAGLVDALATEGTKVPSLRIIQFAGSILPAPVAAAARRLTGAAIHNLYGSTETGTVAARYEDSDDPFDAGFVTEGTAVEIVDDADRVLPAGATGTIRYRRPLQATEYFRDPEASARVFRDGWFYPGDLGTLAADGRLRLAGRASEIVNAGGVKVDPARVDAAAAGLPGIRDAAAFAFVNRVGLMEVALAIVTGPTFDAATVVRRLRAELGSAAPSVLFTIDAIPRNRMGKPLRHELAALYATTGA
ncbi:MAG: class I adenylate-forming enzyme family protein [Chloroflexota bacterium]